MTLVRKRREAVLAPGIASFLAVAEARSFVRAGKALGLTQSGVRRGIARLEEHVRVRLFQRTALVGEGFDAAVRFGVADASSSLVVRKILDTRVMTVASKEYVARRGRPTHPKQIEQHDCVLFRDTTSGKPLEWIFQTRRRPERRRSERQITPSQSSAWLVKRWSIDASASAGSAPRSTE